MYLLKKYGWVFFALLALVLLALVLVILLYGQNDVLLPFGYFFEKGSAADAPTAENTARQFYYHVKTLSIGGILK